MPTPETKVLFHFASHVHPVFEQNPHYEIKSVIDSFTTLLPYCYDHGIMFVYPSSALVYERDTQFKRFKKTLEQLANCYQTKTLGLRIFPTYGPGEKRTVIYQWCHAMQNGCQPVVYGDGRQTRDFIFIDDVVDQIMTLVEERCWESRLVNIGSGVKTSFNSIVEMINRQLGTDIQPKYVVRPSSYSEGIVCANPMATKVSVEDGIRKILESTSDLDGMLERFEAHRDRIRMEIAQGARKTNGKLV